MLRKLATRWLTLAAALPALSACSSTIAYPRLAGPGTAPVQRARSEVYDPYPVADGGPKIVGGRPIDFATPRNEVTISRQFSDQQRAMLGAGRGAPAVIATMPLVQTAPGYAPVGQPPSPVVGPAVPAYPSYPTYPTTPVATPSLPSNQPPVQYRY